MAGVEGGLRERKKARTREAIVGAALRLFADQGFDHVTIAQIAGAADIAPRTFFGYFRSKEDILFWDFEESLASLRTRLTEREPGETAVDAMRAWIEGLLRDTDFADPRERCRRRLIRESEVLAAHDRKLMGRFEEALAEAVAVDLGGEPARARMVAGAAIAALSILTEYFKEDEDPVHALGGDPMRVIDEALTFVRGGIAALQE
jgi:AcrR family transcriptional regulator